MNTNNLQRGRLYSTSIYDMFTQNASNRPQHEDSVLEESMRAHGFLSAFPIRCSHGSPGKLVVNQGHHRLHYAKRLKIPVYFVIDDTPIDIWELEGSSKNRWSSADFVESRARSGHPEYRALLSYQKKHKLTLGAASALLQGNTVSEGNALKDIKRGDFKRGDPKHGEMVIAVLDALAPFNLSFVRSSSFVKAVSMMVRIPELNHAQLLLRAASQGHRLAKRATAKDYLSLLQDLYNYGSRAPLAVALRAVAVCKRRQETFGRES